MATPQVSVLIDTYNHERYIEQAIESVLAQTLAQRDIEIVVVDDGSTDRTAEIVRKFEPRVRLIRKKNGGQASAFNAGIPELCAPLVAFLDGDDWWAEGKLLAVLDTFEKNPEIAAVGHGFFEAKGSARPTEMFTPQATCFLDLSSVEAARVADLGRTSLGSTMLTVRHGVLDRVGRLPEELVFCGDTPILTLALALGGAIVLDQPLCYYRKHSQNLFAGSGEDKRKLRRRAEILGFLLDMLPPRLRELGVSEEIISTLFEPDRIEFARIKLCQGEGNRWTTMKTEMRDFHSSYKNASLGYTAFRCAAAAAALLLPPQRFYDLRTWYSGRNLRRLRGVFFDAEPVVSTNMFARRPVTKSET